MSYSLDVNLLLYASDASSPFHAKAKRFLDSCMGQRDVMYLTWPVIMSYLRIVTHPSIFDEPLSPEEARANVETLLNLPNTRCVAEEEGFWGTLRATTEATPVRGNLVPDAHLAALLRLHGIRRLYTHDRDYLKFDFLDIQDPLA